MVKRVEFYADAFMRETAKNLERAMAAVGAKGEYFAKTDALNRPGDGKIYSRGKSKYHVASSPGNPPAADTGRLRASTTHEVLAYPDARSAKVIVNTNYALPLDEGTERIAPRPFRVLILNAMRQALPGALRRYL